MYDRSLIVLSRSGSVLRRMKRVMMAPDGQPFRYQCRLPK